MATTTNEEKIDNKTNAVTLMMGFKARIGRNSVCPYLSVSETASSKLRDGHGNDYPGAG